MRGFVVLCSLVFITSLILNGCDSKDSVNSSTNGSVAIKDGNSSNSNNTDSKSDNGQKDNNSSDKNSSNNDNGSKKDSDSKDKGDDKKDNGSKDNGDNNNSKNNNNDNKKSDDGKKDNNSSKKDSDSKDKEDDNKKDSNNTIKTLTLSIEKATLNKDYNTTIDIKATYSDNTTKTPNNIEWLIIPKDAIRIKGNTIIALKDTNVTIQAKVGDILSNKVHLNIYWEVNGYRLPPEPDPKINNATLLGIDANNNGVRDDVERWIYNRYKDKHPIYIDIAMQAARGYKLVLEHPERAKEIREKVNSALICGWYYQHEAEEFGDKVLVHERIDSPVFGRYFNTKQRTEVYRQYDMLLSGDSYDIPWADEMKKFCDFNTSKYDKE